MTVYLLVQDAGDEPEMETFHVGTRHANAHSPACRYRQFQLPFTSLVSKWLAQVARRCPPDPWFRIRAKQPNRTAKVQARGSQVQDATCGRALYYCSVALIKAQKCQSGMVA